MTKSPVNQKVEAYVQLRVELDQLMIVKKTLEADLTTLTEELIGYMEQNPIGSLESEEGFTLHKGVRRSPDITDWNEIRQWADVEGDDFILDHWDELQAAYPMKDVQPGCFIEQPNRRLLGVVLKHYADVAKAEGKDMNDLLPPGLGQKATEYLIMRKPSKKRERKKTEDSILEMAKRGALLR